MEPNSLAEVDGKAESKVNPESKRPAEAVGNAENKAQS